MWPHTSVASTLVWGLLRLTPIMIWFQAHKNQNSTMLTGPSHRNFKFLYTYLTFSFSIHPHHIFCTWRPYKGPSLRSLAHYSLSISTCTPSGEVHLLAWSAVFTTVLSRTLRIKTAQHALKLVIAGLAALHPWTVPWPWVVDLAGRCKLHSSLHIPTIQEISWISNWSCKL